MSKVRRLSCAAKLLGLWFMYSDGFNAILQTAILIVSSEIDVGCLGLQVVLALLIVEVQVIGGLGSYVMERVASKYRLPDKAVVLGCLAVFCLVSAYSLLGFFSESFGLHSAADLFVVTGFVAFVMVPIQSQSRSLFASVIPKGLEAEFFSLYSITWVPPPPSNPSPLLPHV